MHSTRNEKIRSRTNKSGKSPFFKHDRDSFLEGEGGLVVEWLSSRLLPLVKLSWLMLVLYPMLVSCVVVVYKNTAIRERDAYIIGTD